MGPKPKKTQIAEGYIMLDTIYMMIKTLTIYTHKNTASTGMQVTKFRKTVIPGEGRNRVGWWRVTQHSSLVTAVRVSYVDIG